MSGEIALTGGNTGTVVRVGDTVRRETGPWTPAVHRLLQVYASAGIEAPPGCGAPTTVGVRC